MLKISGEALQGKSGFGVDPEVCPNASRAHSCFVDPKAQPNWHMQCVDKDSCTWHALHLMLECISHIIHTTKWNNRRGLGT